MNRSNVMFRLVTTVNEHGEGTGIESCVGWETKSGHGAYFGAFRSGRFGRLKSLLGQATGYSIITSG